MKKDGGPQRDTRTFFCGLGDAINEPGNHAALENTRHRSKTNFITVGKADWRSHDAAVEKCPTGGTGILKKPIRTPPDENGIGTPETGVCAGLLILREQTPNFDPSP
jgi:hypothetical protein